MRAVRMSFAMICLILGAACAQDTKTKRKTNKSAVAPVEEDKATKVSGKENKTAEKEESGSSDKFCGSGSAPASLKADSEDKILKIGGSSASICDLLENHGVLMFQLIESGCDGCADKIFRTKNFLALSRIQSSIRHVALFSESSAPTGSDVSSLALESDSVANDSKAVLAESFDSGPVKDGTSFLLISSKGTLETFSSDEYLGAIKKAEDLVRASASDTSETTPEALKATSAAWDGTSTRGNKKFALIATE